MRIDLLFPALPPAYDGIGDHTAHLGAALAPRHDVRILTASPDADPVPGCRVTPAFDLASRAGIQALAEPLASDVPDWLVLQYNPFSYGRWGLNLSLPRTISALRTAHPQMRVALMVHEPFVPVENWRFALFTTWQRWQLWALGSAADAIFFSIEPWVDRFRAWFPNTPLHHLPVGSNIDRTPAHRTADRTQLGLQSSDIVCGLFGSAHESRDFDLVRTAMLRLLDEGLPVRVLHVGTGGDQIRDSLGPDVPLVAVGPQPAPLVSRYLSAMDLYLAPFRKGLSARRGSVMAALQHARPVVTTLGPDTGPALQSSAGTAFLAVPLGRPAPFTEQVRRLALDPALREHIGEAGQALYQSTFDWPRLAERMESLLSPSVPSPRSRAPVS